MLITKSTKVHAWKKKHQKINFLFSTKKKLSTIYPNFALIFRSKKGGMTKISRTISILKFSIQILGASGRKMGVDRCKWIALSTGDLPIYCVYRRKRSAPRFFGSYWHDKNERCHKSATILFLTVVFNLTISKNFTI